MSVECQCFVTIRDRQTREFCEATYTVHLGDKLSQDHYMAESMTAAIGAGLEAIFRDPSIDVRYELTHYRFSKLVLPPIKEDPSDHHNN